VTLLVGLAFSRLVRPGGSAPQDAESESIRSLASLIVRGHDAAFLDESYQAHRTAPSTRS
jgi:hypothetical protein